MDRYSLEIQCGRFTGTSSAYGTFDVTRNFYGTLSRKFLKRIIVVFTCVVRRVSDCATSGIFWRNISSPGLRQHCSRTTRRSRVLITIKYSWCQITLRNEPNIIIHFLRGSWARGQNSTKCFFVLFLLLFDSVSVYLG